MLGDRPEILARAVSRVNHWSTRARDRVRSLPIRASYRSQGLPIPPARLIYLVAGTEDVSWFLDSGAMAAHSLREILKKNGLAIESFSAILDFGCGAGRVLRHWHCLLGTDVHGTDYNPNLIAWCAKYLPFAHCQVNGLGGGFDYADESFDFIYALSVFTHLSEPRQFSWIAELSRVLRPGGHLLLTTHGSWYLPQLSASEQEQFGRGQPVIHGTEQEGRNDCAVFHPESYVRETLAQGFQVVDHIPEGALGNPRQDLYLLRKPF